MAEEERMGQVVIPYPEDIPQALRLSEREFGAELAFLAAAKLYELGRLSADRAARLAGRSKLDFLVQLSSLVVSAFNLDDEEMALASPTAEEWAAPAATSGRPSAEDAEDLRLQLALIEAGLTTQVLPLGARAAEPDPPPLQIDGEPLSATVIRERR